MSIIDTLKEANQKSLELAEEKLLIEAVETVELALSSLAEKRRFWDKLWGKTLINNLVEELQQNLATWHKSIETAETLYEQAQKILRDEAEEILTNKINPWNTQALSNAIGLYQLYSQIIYNQKVIYVIEECQGVLAQKQKFQSLVKDGNLQLENRFFQQAIASYKEALKLYDSDSVKAAIAKAEIHVHQEQIYESALQKAQEIEQEGKISKAIAILETALTDFPRSDGRELLKKLKSTFQGRENFKQGLKAEQIGNFHTATIHYLKAKSLLPNAHDCQIRLGLVAIKTQDWQNAIFYLENLPGEQAAYLRGFAFAQKSNLQLAYREWQNISNPQINQQKEIIKQISQQKRLEYLGKIEELVEKENLDQASKISQEFIAKFGNEPVVESNIYEYIQPRLQSTIWQDNDWKIIAEEMKQIWINQPNITNLHNWTIANYYLAQTDTNKLFDLIVSLFTALVNIKLDPHLQDIPWLGNKKVDFQTLSAKLKKQVENLIDNVKDVDLPVYLKLRDRYRRETVALNLIGEPPIAGMVINDLFLTPGCYSYFREQWKNSIVVQNIQSQDKILHCLYTPWGLAVAACLEGDTYRSIELKPKQQPTTEIQLFADQFVAYHQGYYYLQQKNWREAIIHLIYAKPQIQNNPLWQQEIDTLCISQRQFMSELKEHLEFAQFWYNLLGTASASNYLAEYKAEALREQLLSQQISLDNALQGLEMIKKIDENNPVVMGLMEKIEINQELEEIEKLFNNNQLEAMKTKAKLSRHYRIRYVVAELLIDILTNRSKNANLDNSEMSYQLGKWVYELCPDEPKFQNIYQGLQLC